MIKKSPKNKSKMSAGKMMAIGTAAIAGAVGAYALVGPNGKKNQKKAKAWIKKMGKEVEVKVQSGISKAKKVAKKSAKKTVTKVEKVLKKIKKAS